MKACSGFSLKPLQSARRGFTLVELLVAVSVLVVGIVGVLRSFLSTVSVLDNLNNRLSATQVLDEKINETTAFVLLGDKDYLQEKHEEFTLNGRKAFFRSEITPLNDPMLTEDLSKVSMSMAWQEGNAPKDETITFLLPINK